MDQTGGFEHFKSYIAPLQNFVPLLTSEAFHKPYIPATIYIIIIQAFPVILQIIMSEWLNAFDGVIVERTDLLL